MENIFTLDEAMDYLKVSYSTMLRLVKSGRLKSYKLGREYRITETDMKEFFYAQDGKTFRYDKKKGGGTYE